MKTVLAAALLGLLAACASTGPGVSSIADPEADIGALTTFGFVHPLGTDRPGSVRMPLTNMLASAVISELEARGLRQADEPDVLVNFFVNTEQRLDVLEVPTASSFFGYRRGLYRTWSGYERRVHDYARGTLAIDLVDPARKLLIWEGVAQERLGAGGLEISQAQVNAAVGEVLKTLPR
jgi:hypothetical protein